MEAQDRIRTCTFCQEPGGFFLLPQAKLLAAPPPRPCQNHIIALFSVAHIDWAEGS